ncbi:MAG: NrfD/PsrC family molybdoenzyme membrane anchor subunit [Vulcanimicrobiaceae bacterium]
MTRDPFDLAALSPNASTNGVAPMGDPFAVKQQTYYGQPLLKRPRWDWNVITYLFMGGVMGGSAILVAIADENDDGDRKLARNARYVAFVLAAANPAVLISHLGRPERFHHMLRVVKFKSVMSMGVWGLIGFSVPATLAAVAQAARDGILPGWMRHLGPGWLTKSPMAVLGAFIAGYTGVLLSSTAIPVWAKGKRYIPAFSVCSGLAGACALNAGLLALSSGTEKTRHRLERLELVAALGELGLLLAFRADAGELGKPMFEGERGAKLRNVTMLGGIVAPALLNLIPGNAKWKSLTASALALAGGYVLRETLIESGKGSADDPKAAARQPE